MFEHMWKAVKQYEERYAVLEEELEKALQARESAEKEKEQCTIEIERLRREGAERRAALDDIQPEYLRAIQDLENNSAALAEMVKNKGVTRDLDDQSGNLGMFMKEMARNLISPEVSRVETLARSLIIAQGSKRAKRDNFLDNFPGANARSAELFNRLGKEVLCEGNLQIDEQIELIRRFSAQCDDSVWKARERKRQRLDGNLDNA